MAREVDVKAPASMAVVLLAGLAAACAEEARFGSWEVLRAPHPAWNKPESGVAAPSADEAFRAEPPKAASRAIPELPAVQDGTFANGIRLLTLKRTGLPVVSIRIVVARGAAQAPQGVAAFAAAGLFTGTRWSEGLAVRQALAEMGATFSATAYYDSVAIDAKVPAWNLLPALKVLSEVLVLASYPADEFEMVRAERLVQIDQNAASAAHIAYERLESMLYSPGQPYVTPVGGRREATQRIRRDELVAFWESVSVPPLTTFVLAGDFDRAPVEAKLHALLDQWSGAAPPAQPLPVQAPTTYPRTALVDRPGASQSEIRVGWLVPDRQSAEIPALRTLAELLAHDTTGRLDRQLRLARGDTYGVSAFVAPRVGASELVIGAAIERDHTAEALHELLAEIDQVRARPFSDFDTPGFRALAGTMTWQSFETCTDAVATLTPAAAYQEPLEAFLGRLRAATVVPPEEVQRAATRYLRPETRSVVVVGDVARIGPSLRGTGLEFLPNAP